MGATFIRIFMNRSYLLKASLLGLLLTFFVFLCPVCCAHNYPKVWNISNANLFFVGREAKLHEIHSFFNKGGHILALTGGPGFGKTQIAKKYAQQFQKEYTLVWWIDTQQDIPSQFQKLAVALNHILPEKEKINPSALSKDVLIDRIKDILRLKDITYLLIFDNAETYGQIEKYIPYTGQQSGKHTLLTSRYANIWTDKVEIGKFDRQESITFIRRTLPKEGDEDIGALAESLSDYPLGLTLAVGFIKSSPTATIKKYLSMHMKRTLKNKGNPPSTVLDRYSNDALAALEISLKSIKEDSQDALKALLFMSLLNSKDIPESYIEVWLKKTKSPLTADEAIKYIYDQSLIGVSETKEFNANIKSEGQERMHYLSIHDLIHQLINEKIPIDEKKELIEKATEVMLNVFSGTAEDFVKKIKDEPAHLLHAQKLCENARTIGYVSPNLLKLKVCIFQCLIAPVCNFESAKNYLEKIEENLNSGLELEPYYKALLKINKGFFECIYNVNYDEAIRNMTEGLNLLDSFKDYNDGKLRALTNLAQYYTLRGEPDIAENIINKGKSLFNDSRSVEYKSFFIWAWALVLSDKGKFEDSVQVLNKAKGLPNLFPSWEQGLLQQRIENFIKQGKLKEASEILKKYEKIIQEFFQGRKNIALGNSLFFKGNILIHKRENISEAFSHLNEALKVYKEFFRNDKKHRVQARAHLALGKAYKTAREYEKALQEYLLSEEIYNIVLKEKKIDDVSDLYKELAMLGTDLKDEELTNKYLKAHTKTFGLDHPRTKEIFHYLDERKLSPSMS